MARNNTRDTYFVTLLAPWTTSGQGYRGWEPPRRQGSRGQGDEGREPAMRGFWPPGELQQRPQHVLHDAAVPVVVGLAWRVDPYDYVEFLAIGSHHEFV